MDSMFRRITAVDIGGDEVILGFPSAFNHMFVGSNRVIVHDLEVDVVAAAFQPFHYGAVRRNTLFVAAHFLGCV